MSVVALQGSTAAAVRRANAASSHASATRRALSCRPQGAACRHPHPATPGRRSLSAASTVKVHARRDYEDYDYDYEEDWEDNGTNIASSGGAIVSQALRACGIVADKLTDIAIGFAPATTPPGVVRTAVNAGVILLILAFAKSILGFFLTIGTVVFGAYVSVKLLGLDVSSVGSKSSRPGGGGRSGSSSNGRSKQKPKRKKRDG